MDTGNNAWILTSTALVLFMTLPGLALFYAGMVRRKNVLSTLMQSVGAAAIVTVLWALIAYSLAFSDGGGLNAFVGGLGRIGMAGIAPDTMSGDLPENLFLMFQLTFAIITVAIIAGAAVERIKFSAFMVFSAVWVVLVYAPICHWVWGGGFLGEAGVLDFAGGAVVHINAGVAGLVLAKFVGPRKGYPGSNLAPDNLVLTVAGAGILWVGWFGFNGGSALTATDDASMAIINTHVAAATAALVWVLVEKIAFGKATTVGFATGAIAGLATVTPAAGFISPGAAILFGILAALVCYYAIQLVKTKLAIDDSLDVFAVHGVGGMLGSLLLGIFLSQELGGTGYAEGMTMAGMVGVQALGIAIVALFSAIVTAVIAIGVSLFIPMRVTEEEEVQGLDQTSHGERSWQFD